jgi:hypothetical protein
VSDQQGDARLRAAFQGTAGTPDRECTAEDLEKIWKAVSGELPADERREVVEQVARDPAAAEAWRVAQELWRASGAATQAPASRRFSAWSPAWVAAAAALVLTVGAALVVRIVSPDGDTLRDGGAYVVEPAVAGEPALPRDAFVLRWTAGPQGTRYHVRVTTEALEVLFTAADVPEAQVTVPAERLAGLPAGTRVLWQVEAALPSGESVSSQTFVVRVG